MVRVRGDGESYAAAYMTLITLMDDVNEAYGWKHFQISNLEYRTLPFRSSLRDNSRRAKHQHRREGDFATDDLRGLQRTGIENAD